MNSIFTLEETGNTVVQNELMLKCAFPLVRRVFLWI